MKKRLFYTVLLGIGIVFVPYWIGRLLNHPIRNLFGWHSLEDSWWFFHSNGIIVLLAIVIVFALIFGIFPPLIHWIKYGNK